MPADAIRASTTSEQAGDLVRQLYEQAAEQPVMRLLDLLGVSDMGGMVDEYTTPEEMRVGRIPLSPPSSILGAFFHKGPQGRRFVQSAEPRPPVYSKDRTAHLIEMSRRPPTRPQGPYRPIMGQEER